MKIGGREDFSIEMDSQKYLNLGQLRQDAENAILSHYEHEDKVIVFGEGNPHSKIMLIGEAPGEQETLQKKPFVGQAGKHLSSFLEVLQLRREDIYITNVVKFRPFRVNEATGRKSNRPPDRKEIEVCGRWLFSEILFVRPKIVVTLGNVPLKFLLGNDKKIGDYHGDTVSWNLCGHDTQVFCLYHPASVIYRRELMQIYEQDLIKLRNLLVRNLLQNLF